MLTPEQLATAQEFGELLFTESEILEIMELDKPTPEFKRAIRKGALLSEAKIRKSILKLAQDGSGPAQTVSQKLIDNLKRKEY
jgi:hypothetical protein